jgi:anti-sigma B factor antagonist
MQATLSTMVIHDEPGPDSVHTLRPVGRLDLFSAPSFGEHVARVIGDGHCRLVVDLSGVPFADSTGLAALVAALKATRAAGGDLRVAHTPDQIQLLFELTKLDDVLLPADG